VSFGGLVACEMAAQLTDRGEQDTLLVMIDADITVSAPSAPADNAELMWLAVKPFAEVEEVAGLSDPIRPAFTESLAIAARAGMLPPDLGMADLNRFLRLLERTRGLAAMAPRPIDADVLVLRAQAGGMTNESVSALADLVSGRVSVLEVPGDHYTVMTRHADAVGTQLGEYLAELNADRMIDTGSRGVE